MADRLSRCMVRILTLVLCLSLLSSTVPLTAIAESIEPTPPVYIDVYNTASWMAYLPDDMQISQINMPGTHDSGCADVTPQPWLNAIIITAKSLFWSLIPIPVDKICFYLGGTQSSSIQKQMSEGMRCFDIRLRTPSGSNVMDMRLCHDNKLDCLDVDGSGKLTLNKCISYAKQFLKDNPSETIIFQLSADDEKDETRPMIRSVVEKYSDPNADPKIIAYRRNVEEGQAAKDWQDQQVPKLGDVRGKIVLIWDQEHYEETINTYEMHYSYYGSENTSPTKKAEIISNITRDPVSFGWHQDYFSQKASKDFWRDEKFRYPNAKGDPAAPKIIGTNITTLDGFDADAIVNIVFGDLDLKNLAQSVWSKTKALGVTLQKGYRYGWITMDFPDTDFTKQIIESNFLLPGYAYSVTITNVPENLRHDLKATGLRLHGIHETIPLSSPQTPGNDQLQGGLTIHTQNELLSYLDISPVQRINLGGTDYFLVRTSQIYEAYHGENIPMPQPLPSIRLITPGLTGTLKETYTLTTELPLIAVNVPRFDWDHDNHGASRPSDLRDFARSIGMLTWKKTTEDGNTDLYTLTNTDKNLGPYLTGFTVQEAGNDHTYWNDITAYLPAVDENNRMCTYEFVSLSNQVSDSIYDWDYIPTGEPTLHLTLRSSYDWMQGPRFVFVDHGENRHIPALYSLKQQGIKHTAYKSSGAIAFTENISEHNILCETSVDRRTQVTQLYGRRYDNAGVSLRHEFQLPEHLGTGTWTPYMEDPYYVLGFNSDHPDRYYAVAPLEVKVVWEDADYGDQMRPDAVGFSVSDPNAGYDDYEMITRDNAWTLNAWAPVYYDGDDEFTAVNYKKYCDASPVNGYIKKVEVETDYDRGVHVTVTYTLDDVNYVDVHGIVFWNDGDLAIPHAAADTHITVLQDNQPMDPGSPPQFSMNLLHDEPDWQEYRFEPRSAFPIWKDAAAQSQYAYSVDPAEMDGYRVTTINTDVFYTRLVTVSGTVDWQNHQRPANTQPIVALLRNDRQISIQECENFQYSFDGLPVAAEDGIPYQYSIQAIMPSDSFHYAITYDQPQRNPSTGNVTANAVLRKIETPVTAEIPMQLKLDGPSEAAIMAKSDCFDFLLTCTSGDSIPSQYIHLDRSTGLTGVFHVEGLTDFSKTYTFSVQQINTDLLPWWQYDTTVGTVSVDIHLTNDAPVAAVTMDPQQGNHLTFTNVYRGGDLNLAKILEGQGCDPDKTFDFLLEMTSQAVDGSFGGVHFEDGVAHLSLKGGQAATIKNLPNGVGCTIIEADYYADGYISDHPDGLSEMIVENAAVPAVFKNTRISPFSFTVKWSPTALKNIGFALYAADGTKMDIPFTRTIIDPNTWVYVSERPVRTDCFVVQTVPEGYTVTYENSGAYTGETDRCRSGGVITNHLILTVPETGDNGHPVLWTLTLLLALTSIALLTRKRKET